MLGVLHCVIRSLLGFVSHLLLLHCLGSLLLLARWWSRRLGLLLSLLGLLLR